MPRTLTWSVRVAVVTLLAGASVVAAAVSAEAHASLLSSSPGDGAMLAQPPDAVVLRFDEPVDVGATAVRVFSGSGETIRLGSAEAVGDPTAAAATGVRVPLPALADDQYLVRWATTTGGDFHPVSGSFVFSVGVPLQPGFASSQADSPPWGNGIEALLRFVGLLGLAGAVGGGALLARLSRVGSPTGDLAVSRLGGWTRRSAVLGSAGVAALGLVLLTRAGSLPSGHVGVAWLAAVAGLLVAALSAGRRDRGHAARGLPATAWLGLVAAAWGVAVLGHGSGRPAAGLPGSLVATAHVLATSTWLGGAALLSALVVPAVRRGDSAWARTALSAFAAVAAPAFGLSIVTGLLLASALVPSEGALTGSAYGRVLLAKLVLVGLAAVAGAMTFRAVRRAPGRRRPPSRRLVLECGVLGTVALLAAVLATVSSPSGPAWAPGDGGPAGSLLSAGADDLLVTVRLSPGTPGPNVIRVAVVDTRRPAPGTVSAVEVVVGDGPVVAATAMGGPDWLVPTTTIGDGGPQDLRITVLREGAPDARAALVWQPAAPSEGTGSGGRSLRGPFLALAGLVAALACVSVGVVVVRRRRHVDALSSPVAVEGALVRR